MTSALRSAALSAAASVLCFAALSGQTTPADTAWNGDYDLVGSGFEEGERMAQLTVMVRDTICACMLQGPPGQLASATVKGDSLRILWNLGEQELVLVLARHEGALRGTWLMGMQGGTVVGTRRR